MHIFFHAELPMMTEFFKGINYKLAWTIFFIKWRYASTNVIIFIRCYIWAFLFVSNVENKFTRDTLYDSLKNLLGHFSVVLKMNDDTIIAMNSKVKLLCEHRTAGDEDAWIAIIHPPWQCYALNMMVKILLPFIVFCIYCYIRSH